MTKNASLPRVWFRLPWRRYGQLTQFEMSFDNDVKFTVEWLQRWWWDILDVVVADDDDDDDALDGWGLLKTWPCDAGSCSPMIVASCCSVDTVAIDDERRLSPTQFLRMTSPSQLWRHKYRGIYITSALNKTVRRLLKRCLKPKSNATSWLKNAHRRNWRIRKKQYAIIHCNT